MATREHMRGHTCIHEGGGAVVTACKSFRTILRVVIFNNLRVTKTLVTGGDSLGMSPNVTKVLVTSILLKIKKDYYIMLIRV